MTEHDRVTSTPAGVNIDGALNGNAAASSPSRAASEGCVPARGELGIKERRSWRTWQLVVAGVVALVIGMVLGSTGNGSASSPQATGGYKLPPPAGTSGSSSSTSVTSAGSSATSSTTTTSPAGSSTSTTTSAGATSATTTPTGPVVVLLGPTQSKGTWTSHPFTVGGGTWNIGWDFQCTPAPASGPSFQVFVFPSGGTPGATPAVNESGGSAQSVTPQKTAGSLELKVQAPANCIWIVKVTGIA